MGKTIDFEMENEIKLKIVKKELRKRLKGDWTEKQLNDFILNTLLKQYETSRQITAAIDCYWRDNE